MIDSLTIHPDKPSRPGTEGQFLVGQISRNGTSGRVPFAISTSRSLNTVLHVVPVPSGGYEVHSSINSCETYWDSAAADWIWDFSRRVLAGPDAPPSRFVMRLVGLGFRDGVVGRC